MHENTNNEPVNEDQTTADTENQAETEARAQAEPDVQAEVAAEAQAQEYLQMLQRVQADFDNFRRRIRIEKEEAQKYCSQRLITSLLPVLDNFERALNAGGEDVQSFMAGMELIFRQFRDVLEKEGLQAIQAVGEEFDPTKHEAVMTVASPEHANNTVVEDLQKGYLLLDRVIRPAMVKVASN